MQLEVNFSSALLLLVLAVVSVKSNEYRLPQSPVPKKYFLELKPYFEDSKSVGRITVELDYESRAFDQFADGSNAFHVALNRAEDLALDVSKITAVMKLDSDSCPLLNDSSHLALKCDSENFNNKTQISELRMNDSVANVKAAFQQCGADTVRLELVVPFNATLRTDMSGFYVSSYTVEDTTVQNAVTQFESTDARGAFPCWDEPAFKAQFELQITAPMNATVLSNMPVAAVDSGANVGGDCPFTTHTAMQSTACKSVRFTESPPMSSYIVAFIVGDYNSVSTMVAMPGPFGNSTREIPLNVYFPWDFEDTWATYALSEAAKILPFYEQLYGVEYPLDKMDVIALHSFAAGAMENWGLVTYRTTALLADESTSSIQSLKRVSYVIAHEFAHLWFGDTVTMQWWDNLWLNEGFASFMEDIGTNYSQPSYKIWDSFLLAQDSMLSTDVSQWTHPIQQSVANPGEISSLFDSITYDKGAAVIRMLHSFMGCEDFFKGIQAYLKKYRFSNANNNHLWAALQPFASDDTNVTALMNNWILQPGFPLLTVELTAQTDESFTFSLTQTRMKYEFGDDGSDNTQLWQIPLTLQKADGSVESVSAMTDASYEFTRERVQKTKDAQVLEYYLFNPQMTGVYRVTYDNTLLSQLLSAFTHLEPLNQFSILADSFALTQVGHNTADSFLELLNNVMTRVTADNAQMSKERISYAVWEMVVSSLISIDSVFCEYGVMYSIDDSVRWNASETESASRKRADGKKLERDSVILGSFREFARSLLTPVWEAVGKWTVDSSTKESVDVTSLRPVLAIAMIRFGNKDAIESGRKLLVETADYNLEEIDGNLVRAVIEAALAYDATNDDTATLSWLKETYLELGSNRKRDALRAIGAVYGSEILIESALEFVLSDNVRDGDKMTGLYSCRRCHGRFMIWKQIFDDASVWEQLSAVYGSGFLEADITELPDSFASDELKTKVQAFYGEGSGHRNSANDRSVNETIESVAATSAWLDANRDSVTLFLKDNGYWKDSSGGGHKEGVHWVLVVAIALCVFTVFAIFAWRCYENRLSTHTRYQRHMDEDFMMDEQLEDDDDDLL